MYPFSRAPRRICGASSVLRAMTAPAALTTVVVLVSLGNPLLLVAAVVLAVLVIDHAGPTLAMLLQSALLGRGTTEGAAA